MLEEIHLLINYPFWYGFDNQLGKKLSTEKISYKDEFVTIFKSNSLNLSFPKLHND